jgi:hypothetical protein
MARLLSSTVLSEVQQQNVDASFEKLFGYPWGMKFQVQADDEDDENDGDDAGEAVRCDINSEVVVGDASHSKTAITARPTAITNTSKVTGTITKSTTSTKKKDQQYRQQLSHHERYKLYRYLSPIVGTIQAAKIVRMKGRLHAHQDFSSNLSLPTSLKASETDIPVVASVDESKISSAPALIGAKNEMNNRQTSPSVLSAGEAVSVAPISASGPAVGNNNITSIGSGMDQLLAHIKNESKSSSTTVMKTAMDWESFKDQSGLGSTLEEKAESSTALLKQHDFLLRVDHRQFEQEKTIREKERAARGK